MPKYIEHTTAREFAMGIFPDPILRMAVNRLLEGAPAADAVSRPDFGDGASGLTSLITWLRNEADQSTDQQWKNGARKVIYQIEELERNARWVPAYRHPDDGTVVLVTDGLRIDTAMYDADQDSYEVEHAFLDPGEVVAWKSLSSLKGAM